MSSESTPRADTDFVKTFINELTSVVGALSGIPATVSPAKGTIEQPWTVAITGDPTSVGLTLGLSQEDVAQLVKLVSGAEGEPTEQAIIDLLKEIVGQTVSSLREKPAGRDSLVSVEMPVPPSPSPSDAPACFVVSITPDCSPLVAVWTAAEPATESVALPRPLSVVRAGATTIRPDKPAAVAAPSVPSNLDVILDIDLPLSVRFGQTDMSLDALTRLGPGSVIDLGRSPDDPVDVLVNGRLVARAEVVVVAGHYGVRILEVVSAADRVQSLRA